MTAMFISSFSASCLFHYADGSRDALMMMVYVLVRRLFFLMIRLI